MDQLIAAALLIAAVLVVAWLAWPRIPERVKRIGAGLVAAAVLFAGIFSRKPKPRTPTVEPKRLREDADLKAEEASKRIRDAHKQALIDYWNKTNKSRGPH